jgi:hypothetical protein
VKEPRIDDERMSALLEGKLHGDQRDELLKELAASDDDYDVFAETASVLRELEDAEAGVVRLPDRKGTPAWVRWGAIAAVLAAIALVPVLASRGWGAAGDPVRLAALAGVPEELPEGWREDRWSMKRGGESSVGDAQAAQAGAFLVDLVVAVEARDTADTRLLAVQARARFDRRSGSAAPLSQIAARAGAPADSLRPLVAQASERLAERLGEDHLRLGAWVEAARLAVRQRNEAFFRDAAGAVLTRAKRLTRDDSAARTAVERVRAAIPPEGAPDWTELSSSLDKLLDELAS